MPPPPVSTLPLTYSKFLVEVLPRTRATLEPMKLRWHSRGKLNKLPSRKLRKLRLRKPAAARKKKLTASVRKKKS